MTSLIALLVGVRLLSLTFWIANLVRLAPAAFRAFTHRRRYLDPIWAVGCGLASNRLWFVSRDIYYHPEPGPIEAGALVIGYMTACALSAALFHLRGSYGD